MKNICDNCWLYSACMHHVHLLAENWSVKLSKHLDFCKSQMKGLCKQHILSYYILIEALKLIFMICVSGELTGLVIWLWFGVISCTFSTHILEISRLWYFRLWNVAQHVSEPLTTEPVLPVKRRCTNSCDYLIMKCRRMTWERVIVWPTAWPL